MLHRSFPATITYYFCHVSPSNHLFPSDTEPALKPWRHLLRVLFCTKCDDPYSDPANGVPKQLQLRPLLLIKDSLTNKKNSSLFHPQNNNRSWIRTVLLGTETANVHTWTHVPPLLNPLLSFLCPPLNRLFLQCPSPLVCSRTWRD